MKSKFARIRANFYTGLAVVLPVVISIAIVSWLFGSVANMTDKLLFFLKYFLEKPQLYANGVSGEMHWYWSMLALLLSVLLLSLVGCLARYYFGRKLIQWMELVLYRIPLLNKIYGALKQINEAFTNNNRSSFKQVVMLEFPRPGLYSVGFITSTHHQEVQAKTKENVVSVFIPTTPNPTTGFLILVPEEKLTRLEMPVADGIKFIISLGSVAPPYLQKIAQPLGVDQLSTAQTAPLPSEQIGLQK